jgi:uroporphyrinogen decarboxylase
MTTTLSHRERLQACLADDPALDRPPVVLWRHFPGDDQDPDTLADAILHFQHTYDFDLVKVTPASSFCLKDWGVTDAWEGHFEGTRTYGPPIIEAPGDWARLPVLAPSAPHLAAQLACLRRLRAELGPDVPILQTVFAPLAQAKNLAGPERLVVHLRQHPDAVLAGLATIVATTRQFVAACLDTGIDGVFFAVQHGQAGVLNHQECLTYGLSPDLDVLMAAKPLWCSMLHLHGKDVYFDLAARYGLPIVNWHDREGGPPLTEARAQVSSVLCGGLSRKAVTYGAPAAVRAEAADALAQTGGRRFILGTGCVTPVIAPHGNLLAARAAVADGSAAIGGRGASLGLRA